MDLRDELEQKQQEAKALGELTAAQKKDLAGKTDIARKNAILRLAREYGDILEEIREIEMDIAEEEDREPPAELTKDERDSLQTQFYSKVVSSLEKVVSSQKETKLESNLRSMAADASGTSLYDSLEQYIKQVVPFNPETNNNINMKQMFSREFDEIDVKNLADYPHKDALKQLRANMEGKQLPPEWSIFTSNIGLLMEAAESKRSDQADFSLEGTYKIDVGKFFGAIDLSDADSRESVYEYWKAIDAKYDDFTNALKAFLDAAEQSENEDFANRVKKFRDKYGEGSLSLRYVYDVAPINTQRVGPKKRLLQVIENLLIVENLADRVEHTIARESEEDRLTDEETNQLLGFKETFSDAMEMNMQEETVDDVYFDDEADPEEKATREDFEEALRDDVDILLATEMMKNTRLISATDDMATLLRQYLDMVVDMLPENKFKSIETYIDRFKDEIKNSLILEREDYFIPVSVMIQPQVKNQLKGGMSVGLTPDEAEEEIERIAEFFDDFEIMLKDWENQTILEVAPRGGQAKTSIESRDAGGLKLVVF